MEEELSKIKKKLLKESKDQDFSASRDSEIYLLGELNGIGKAIDVIEKLFNSKNGSIEFYSSRMKEVQKYKNNLPEPHLTKICNILANGKPEP